MPGTIIELIKKIGETNTFCVHLLCGSLSALLATNKTIEKERVGHIFERLLHVTGNLV